jgi:pSer/pThr/pTyr-binding forkhead associated (FHA) protein
VIGRNPTTDITLLDEGISREHALLLWDEDTPGYVIEDLASTNGTKLNGKRIRSAPLSEGDEIQVGQTRFRFQLVKDA